jgi:hypothetical protein
MNDSWFRDYVFLAFRIDKALRAVSEHSPFVDCYYGPPEWNAQVAAEPIPLAPTLLRQALDLTEAISRLEFEPQRMVYLRKQVLAMQTICQKLCGETFTLEEELQRCFDLHGPLSRTPETFFEQTWARAEEKLPGTGDFQQRVQMLEQRLTLPQEHAEQMVDLLSYALAEAGRRTRSFLDLPANESILVQAVRGQRWMANNQFQGQAHSRLDINLDTMTYLPPLLSLACHEGYPGHHSEYVLKEQHLYLERGYVEQAIGLLMSPQAVISEGIATLATEMLFTKEEEQHWLAEQMYPRAGVHVSPEEASWTSPTVELWMSVQRNAALLLHEGYAKQEVQQYLQQYLRIQAKEAEQLLAYLQRPFREAYVFTYTAGADLMRPWLQGADRHTVFTRFLTEPITPSDLQGATDYA